MLNQKVHLAGIWGDSGVVRGKLLGFGIFPRLCMFNHSCLPNVTISQAVCSEREGFRTRTLSAHVLDAVQAGQVILRPRPPL